MFFFVLRRLDLVSFFFGRFFAEGLLLLVRRRLSSRLLGAGVGGGTTGGVQDDDEDDDEEDDDEEADDACDAMKAACCAFSCSKYAICLISSSGPGMGPLLAAAAATATPADPMTAGERSPFARSVVDASSMR